MKENPYQDHFAPSSSSGMVIMGSQYFDRLQNSIGHYAASHEIRFGIVKF